MVFSDVLKNCIECTYPKWIMSGNCYVMSAILIRSKPNMTPRLVANAIFEYFQMFCEFNTRNVSR